MPTLTPLPSPAARTDRRQALRRLAAAPLVALPVAAGLGACAGLGGPTVITFGEAELAALLARTFPLQRRLLDLLDLQFEQPRLRLQPERNRLALALAVQLRERLRGSAARGRLAFDSALRWEPRDASVRLVQVRVQELVFDGGAGSPVAAAGSAAPAPAPAAVGAVSAGGPGLAAAIAERVLEDLPLHHLGAERLAALRRWGLQPGAVAVTARGVELTLVRASG